MRRDSPGAVSQLCRSHVESGKSEVVLRGVPVAEYDISDDENRVVFSTQSSGKASQRWLAYLDGRSPTRLIASSGENVPHFARDGQVVFQFTEGWANYIGQMKEDGSHRFRMVANPIFDLHAISPDRRWVIAGVPSSNGGETVAVPIGEGASRLICNGDCPTVWAPDGKFLYVGLVPSSQRTEGKTLVFPIRAGESLPKLPASGIPRQDWETVFPGYRVIEAWHISPGSNPSIFAYVKTTVHRNLFRISLSND